MKKIFTFLILIIFILNFFILSRRNKVIYAETIDNLKENINNNKKKLDFLLQESIRIQKELSKTIGKKSNLRHELSIINQEKKSLENNIFKTKVRINILNEEIKEKENNINSKLKSLKQQKEGLELLLRNIDQIEKGSFLERILDSGSISHLFYMRDIYLNLQNLILVKINLLKKTNNSLQEEKLQLEDKQNILSSEKEILADQKTIILNQEYKKRENLLKTKKKEVSYQKNLKNTQEKIKAINKQIRDFESKLKFILDKNSIPLKGSEVFDWPLPKRDIYVTQRFGKTTSSGVLYTSGSHSGTDFRASIGTPVYAVADGTVRGTGNTDEACPGISFGRWIFIEHDIGLSTTYGHLSKIKTTKGKRVKKGDLIGYSGNSGHTTGPHLHLTTYATYGKSGTKVVQIKSYDSWTCPGKVLTRPSAPTKAYLNSIGYLPFLPRNKFKHPRL